MTREQMEASGLGDSRKVGALRPEIIALPRFVCLICLIGLLTPGCRTPRSMGEIEHLTPNPPPYPVVSIDYLSDTVTADENAQLVQPANVELLLVPNPQLFEESHDEAQGEAADKTAHLEPPQSETVTAGLSLEALEQLAEMHNPTLRQAALAIQAARGRRYQAGLYPNPTLGYLGSEIGNEGQAGQQGGYIGQTIVTGHKLAVNRALASRVVDQQLWRYQAQQWRVLNDVALRHAEALGTERIADLTAELERIATEGAEVSQRLFDSQQVGRADVLQADIQRNQIRVLRQNALASAEAARRQLANVVGLTELPEQPLEGSLEGGSQELNFNEVWNQLLASSPLVMIARAEVERTRIQQQVEQLRPVPNLELQGVVQKDFATDDVIYGAQLGMAIPLFDGNQGNLAAAQAEYARARAELERITLMIRDQLTEAWQRYRIAAAASDRYREDIIPLAEENLRLTEEGYRLGEFDFLRVLTARQTYFQTNVEYRRSLIDLRQAEILISGLLLTGGLGDPESSSTR